MNFAALVGEARLDDVVTDTAAADVAEADFIIGVRVAPGSLEQTPEAAAFGPDTTVKVTSTFGIGLPVPPSRMSAVTVCVWPTKFVVSEGEREICPTCWRLPTVKSSNPNTSTPCAVFPKLMEMYWSCVSVCHLI